MYECRQSQLENNAGSVLLTLCGDVGIEHIGQLKEDLLAGFSAGDQVVVDLQDVASVDVSLFQLLCAANRYACKIDKKFALRNQENVVVGERASMLGIYKKHACIDSPAPERCLWLMEGLSSVI